MRGRNYGNPDCDSPEPKVVCAMKGVNPKKLIVLLAIGALCAGCASNGVRGVPVTYEAVTGVKGVGGVLTSPIYEPGTAVP